MKASEIPFEVPADFLALLLLLEAPHSLGDSFCLKPHSQTETEAQTGEPQPDMSQHVTKALLGQRTLEPVPHCRRDHCKHEGQPTV